jgi:eukaryotic translation initiation factor 2C
MECCYVQPGQVMKRQVPQEKASQMVEFATMKPAERLASIRRGLNILNYGQSEYVASFGLNVSDSPVQMQARRLEPPKMRYAAASRQPTIVSFGLSLPNCETKRQSLGSQGWRMEYVRNMWWLCVYPH